MSLAKLQDVAFRSGPAPQANQLIDDVRQQVKRELGASINYEVVVMGRGFPYLQQVIAPRMAFYLHTKRDGIRITFISLFVDEQTLYFVRAADFFDVIRESLRLDEDAFRVVMDHWRRTGKAATELPPPEQPS